MSYRIELSLCFKSIYCHFHYFIINSILFYSIPRVTYVYSFSAMRLRNILNESFFLFSASLRSCRVTSPWMCSAPAAPSPALGRQTPRPASRCWLGNTSSTSPLRTRSARIMLLRRCSMLWSESKDPQFFSSFHTSSVNTSFLPQKGIYIDAYS